MGGRATGAVPGPGRLRGPATRAVPHYRRGRAHRAGGGRNHPGRCRIRRPGRPEPERRAGRPAFGAAGYLRPRTGRRAYRGFGGDRDLGPARFSAGRRDTRVPRPAAQGEGPGCPAARGGPLQARLLRPDARRPVGSRHRGRRGGLVRGVRLRPQRGERGRREKARDGPRPGQDRRRSGQDRRRSGQDRAERGQDRRRSGQDRAERGQDRRGRHRCRRQDPGSRRKHPRPGAENPGGRPEGAGRCAQGAGRAGHTPGALGGGFGPGTARFRPRRRTAERRRRRAGHPHGRGGARAGRP